MIYRKDEKVWGKMSSNAAASALQQEAQVSLNRVELAKDIYTIRSTLHNPELILNEKWQIVGYSNSFLLLTEKVIELAQRRAGLDVFLAGGDFEKIVDYQRTVDRLERLEYDRGAEWELRYRGPSFEEEIGSDWLCSAGEDESLWRIDEHSGRPCLVHVARPADERDCYAMYCRGFGGAGEDILLEYTLVTPEDSAHICDLSAVLSGSEGGVSNYPDISGYTVCTGSLSNTVARLQRLGVDIVSRPEQLAPDTAYRVRIERTGGRLVRRLTDLSTGVQSEPLVMIDPNAVYDMNDFIGFTTYSGAMQIYDVRVYTRPSAFDIGQFKLPFDADVRLREPELSDRIFKLRIGRDVRSNVSLNRLMFEDITERVGIERELKESREQLRELALHLQMIREQERRQIAREIHDELGQALTAMQLDLHGLKKRIPEDNPPLLQKADSMLRLIDVTNQSVQRISTYLRPALLDDLGLNAAIEWQLDEFIERTGIDCKLDLAAGDMQLDEDLATAIFRIFQETLTNIARHAEASRVRVGLQRSNGRLLLEVRDNGRGITRDQVDDPRSFGVIGMRERLFPWGGEIDIRGEPGKGTTVRVQVQLDGEHDHDQNTDS